MGWGSREAHGHDCVGMPRCPVLRPVTGGNGCPGQPPMHPHPVASHLAPRRAPVLMASHPPQRSAIIGCQAAHLARQPRLRE
jgi:hypothetical protein